MSWITKKGYRRIEVGRKKILEHRWVWIMNYGLIPKGYEIHHKDFNKLNNKISNLELMPKRIHTLIHTYFKLIKKGEKNVRKE